MFEKDMIKNGENAKIKVVGVGGGGGNAVTRMMDDGFKDVEFLVVNTDLQALNGSDAQSVLIGSKATRGLGAGANPDVGKKAAEENKEEIKEVLEGTDLLYIAAGMGGGTGTGASPIVAEIAKELDILTIGIVTLPFKFEGRKRMKQALTGKKEFSKYVDTLITIPNDKILETLDEKEAKSMTFEQAFKLADSVLSKAAMGVTTLINEKGHVNLDFADIRTVVRVGGSALMGIGEFKGENPAIKAAKEAMTNPLLTHSIFGAKGVIMNFTSSKNLSFMEISEAATTIEEQVDEDAEILFGHVIADDDNWDDDKVRVTIVATGFPDDDTVFEERSVENTGSNNYEEELSIPQAETIEHPSSNSTTKSFDSLKDLEDDFGGEKMEIPSFLRARGNDR